MSKRDYEAIAKIIAKHGGSAYLQVAAVAREIATHCEEHNPAFDRARFLTACGVGA
jgi:hypothetical protein